MGSASLVIGQIRPVHIAEVWLGVKQPEQPFTADALHLARMEGKELAQDDGAVWRVNGGLGGGEHSWSGDQKGRHWRVGGDLGVEIDSVAKRKPVAPARLPGHLASGQPPG